MKAVWVILPPQCYITSLSLVVQDLEAIVGITSFLYVAIMSKSNYNFAIIIYLSRMLIFEFQFVAIDHLPNGLSIYLKQKFMHFISAISRSKRSNC